MKKDQCALSGSVQLLSSIGLAIGPLLGGLFLLSQTAHAQTGSIEGSVTYYGSISSTQTIQLAVFTSTAQPLPPPMATTSTDSDGGQTWSDWTAPINQGTEGRSATALTVGSSSVTQTLYAGFSGVWYHTRPTLGSSNFTTERVLGELSQPTAIDWSPDGRMFIAHQDGRVLVYADGKLTTFANLSDEVNNNWNRGLLGIEIHPDFPSQPYVYLLYTYDPPGLSGPDGAADGKDGNGSRVNRLVRLTADAGQGYNAAVTGSKTVILGKNSTLANVGNPDDAGGEDWTNPACTTDAGTPINDCLPSEGPSHSVGWLEFGTDGSLFVSNGEGAPYLSPDPRAARAQDLDSLGGKILRIDPETGEGLSDNPFYDEDPRSNRSRVWAYGLRDPFRFFYNGHFHPDFFKVTGVPSGTLQVPYHNDNTTLFICLTATDSRGLRDTECVELFPRTVRYSFDTDPSGLPLTYDGTAYDTPFEIDMMVNAPRSIAAPVIQNGLDFIRWSDGKEASHEIVGKPTPQTLVATYRARIWLPLTFRNGGS